MSNVIKAAAITYTTEKKKIDFNSRAEEFTRLFVEKHASVSADFGENPEAEDGAGASAPEFMPGIPGIFPADAAQESVSGQAEQEVQEQLREQAEQLLAEAQEEARVMLEKAEEDAEEIKASAYNEAQQQGYADGKKQAEKELQAEKKRLAEQEKANRIAYEKQVEELEPAFVEMVIRLVERLTGILLEDKRGIILYLLEQGMAQAEPGMNCLIHVPPEDYETVAEKKMELSRKLREGAELEVVADRTLRPGQCVLETDSRIFDCGLDAQLRNLTGDLRMLAGMPGNAS